MAHSGAFNVNAIKQFPHRLGINHVANGNAADFGICRQTIIPPSYQESHQMMTSE